MLPEERAREKIDKQLINAGWDIVSRNEYVPKSTSAVKEALMQGNTESDYLLFVDAVTGHFSLMLSITNGTCVNSLVRYRYL